MNNEKQICRGFTDAQWRQLRERLDHGDQVAWNCAVEVFNRRIRERFLSCIDALIHADSRADVGVMPGAPADCSTLPDDAGREIIVPGFAILALCCLLIETLQSFRERPEEAPEVTGPCGYPAGGCIRPTTSTTGHFKKFLRLPAFGGEFDDDKIATRFVRGVRNGILHEAETRRWVIWRDVPKGRIVEPQGSSYIVNRGEFYRALKREYERYLQTLRDPANGAIRARFLEKMNDVEKEC